MMRRKSVSRRPLSLDFIIPKAGLPTYWQESAEPGDGSITSRTFLNSNTYTIPEIYNDIVFHTFFVYISGNLGADLLFIYHFPLRRSIHNNNHKFALVLLRKQKTFRLFSVNNKLINY